MPYNKPMKNTAYLFLKFYKSLTGVSIAKPISEEFNCVAAEAQEGAKAFRTLLLGRTFSLPAMARLFRFPAVK